MSNTKHCSVCQKEFVCGARQGEAKCWCASLPVVMPAEFDQDCRCPDCLAQAIALKINAAIDKHSHKEMLEIAGKYKTSQSLTEHIDFTIEGGNYVFTRWYHLKRGSCCGNGCRFCPY